MNLFLEVFENPLSSSKEKFHFWTEEPGWPQNYFAGVDQEIIDTSLHRLSHAKIRFFKELDCRPYPIFVILGNFRKLA